MAIDFSKLLKKGKGAPPMAAPGPAMMEPGGGADTGDVPAAPPPAGLPGMNALMSAPPARKAKPAKRGGGKRGY